MQACLELLQARESAVNLSFSPCFKKMWPLFFPPFLVSPKPKQRKMELADRFSGLISACPPDHCLAAAKDSWSLHCRPTTSSGICGPYGRNRRVWIPRYLGRPSGISGPFPPLRTRRSSGRLREMDGSCHTDGGLQTDISFDQESRTRE